MRILYPLISELSVMLGRELCSQDYNRTDTQQIYVMALYASALELTADALILVDKTRYSGVPILCRSALEALVHMRALMKDLKYYNRMLANVFFEEARMCANAIKLNPGLASANPAIMDDLTTRRDNAQDELCKLKSDGMFRIDIKDSFKLAGLGDRYSPIYANLCSHSHNALNIVANRHFIDSGGSYISVLEREWSDDEIVKYLKVITFIMIDAQEAIADFFKTPINPDIAAMKAAIYLRIETITPPKGLQPSGAPPETETPEIHPSC